MQALLLNHDQCSVQTCHCGRVCCCGRGWACCCGRLMLQALLPCFRLPQPQWAPLLLLQQLFAAAVSTSTVAPSHHSVLDIFSA
jgi:hypothetical protein